MSSLFVVADFNTAAGECILKQALESLVRLLPLPGDEISESESDLADG